MNSTPATGNINLLFKFLYFIVMVHADYVYDMDSVVFVLKNIPKERKKEGKDQLRQY